MPRFALGRPASTLTIAVLLAVAVAACGSGGGTTSDKKSSGLSDAAFIAQADPICTLPPTAPQAQDPIVQAKYIREKLVPFRRQVVVALRKLQPNQALKPKVDRYIAATDRVTDLYGQQAAALAKKDYVKVGDTDVLISQAQAQRNRAAAEVGFKRCGQPTKGPRVTTAGFESAAVLTPADAACKTATDAILASKPKDFQPTTLAQTLQGTLPAQKRALATLDSLRAKATKPTYAQFADLEAKRYQQALKILDAGKANRKAEFERLQREDAQLYAQGEPLAQRLGFTVCGVSSALGF
ncbi:MAG: hypothetical protein QOJ97_2677 [Solirubrobacteraceae bacterium]|nr:hypothetical protein [Solirubrobacteraceae bacterium]